METVLISAFVATLVSLLGVIANIHIARKSRQSAKELEELKAILNIKSDVLLGLKDYLVELEKVRSQGWHLLKTIPTRNVILSKDLIDSFIENNRAIRECMGSITEKWGVVKADISEKEYALFQSYNHNIWNKVLTLASLENMIMDLNMNNDDVSKEGEEKVKKYISETLEREIKEMLVYIEELIGNIRKTRRRLVLEKIEQNYLTT